MLEVTITLNPRGGGPRVGVITITNDETGTEAIGNYDVVLDGPSGETRARVEGFARARGHIQLLGAALDAIRATLNPAPFRIAIGPGDTALALMASRFSMPKLRQSVGRRMRPPLRGSPRCWICGQPFDQFVVFVDPRIGVFGSLCVQIACHGDGDKIEIPLQDLAWNKTRLFFHLAELEALGYIPDGDVLALTR